jgi:hypothetical protein
MIIFSTGQPVTTVVIETIQVKNSFRGIGIKRTISYVKNVHQR